MKNILQYHLVMNSGSTYKCPDCKKYWLYSDTNVTEVGNCFLKLDVGPILLYGNPNWPLVMALWTWGQVDNVSSWKSTSIILLDEHSNKMPPSDLLSYPLLTEASICSGCLLTHIFITGHYAENKGPCFIQPLAWCLIIPFASRQVNSV